MAAEPVAIEDIRSLHSCGTTEIVKSLQERAHPEVDAGEPVGREFRWEDED